MRENELFESHLQRTAPQMLQDGEELQGKRKAQKRSQQVHLTAEQKYDIAVQEMEEVREEIGKMKQDSEQLLDTLRARMEECDVRIAEIKKDAYEFKRDIVTGAENFRTGAPIARGRGARTRRAHARAHHHDPHRGSVTLALTLTVILAAILSLALTLTLTLTPTPTLTPTLCVSGLQARRSRRRRCVTWRRSFAPRAAWPRS